ncbi:MAG: hypothetical protein ABI862_11320 [Ilumatobacteraceae bacterium]
MSVPKKNRRATSVAMANATMATTHERGGVLLAIVRSLSQNVRTSVAERVEYQGGDHIGDDPARLMPRRNGLIGLDTDDVANAREECRP